jgi:hypothetical protein
MVPDDPADGNPWFRHDQLGLRVLALAVVFATFPLPGRPAPDHIRGSAPLPPPAGLVILPAAAGSESRNPSGRSTWGMHA